MPKPKTHGLRSVLGFKGVKPSDFGQFSMLRLAAAIISRFTNVFCFEPLWFGASIPNQNTPQGEKHENENPRGDYDHRMYLDWYRLRDRQHERHLEGRHGQVEIFTGTRAQIIHIEDRKRG